LVSVLPCTTYLRAGFTVEPLIFLRLGRRLARWPSTRDCDSLCWVLGRGLTPLILGPRQTALQCPPKGSFQRLGNTIPKCRSVGRRSAPILPTSCVNSLVSRLKSCPPVGHLLTSTGRQGAVQVQLCSNHSTLNSSEAFEAIGCGNYSNALRATRGGTAWQASKAKGAAIDGYGSQEVGEFQEAWTADEERMMTEGNGKPATPGDFKICRQMFSLSLTGENPVDVEAASGEVGI
jgi:hypothetical protein